MARSFVTKALAIFSVESCGAKEGGEKGGGGGKQLARPFLSGPDQKGI